MGLFGDADKDSIYSLGGIRMKSDCMNFPAPISPEEPFSQINTTVPEPEPEPTPIVVETVTEATPAPPPKKKLFGIEIKWIIIGGSGLGVLVILVGVLLWFVFCRKSKAKQQVAP